MNEHTSNDTITTEETTTTTEITELAELKGFAGWVKLPSGIFLNMALAYVVEPLGSGRSVVFSKEEVQEVRGDDARALIAYLDGEAVDLSGDDDER